MSDKIFLYLEKAKHPQTTTTMHQTASNQINQGTQSELLSTDTDLFNPSMKFTANYFDDCTLSFLS